MLGYRKLQQMKTKGASEITMELLLYRESFEALVRSEEIKEDWITLLVENFGKMCATKMTENLIQVMSILKGSAFLVEHLPKYILQLPFNQDDFEQEELKELLNCMAAFFKEWFIKFPQSCYDVPLDQFLGILRDINVVDVQEIEQLAEKLLGTRKEIITEGRKQTKKAKKERREDVDEPPPPNDFRTMSIYPGMQEIVSDEPPFLRRNRTDRVYNDLGDYLDVQFRLLREDFVAPLRGGIKEIVKNTPRKERSQDLYIYENVQVLNTVCTRSGIVHRIALDTRQLRDIPWEHSKRLLYGSFLCLSRDHFKTMLFATVANRKPEDLKNGNLEIRFVEGLNAFPRAGSSRHTLTMVESPAYFESYRHVLSRLQGVTPDAFPFQKYLVKCSPDVEPPTYLRRPDGAQNVPYDLREVLGASEVHGLSKVPVLEPDAWTTVQEVQTQLNESQLDALKTALTKEFAVIQGPPGTGKVFLWLARAINCHSLFKGVLQRSDVLFVL